MSKCELDFIDEHYVDKDFSMLDKLTLVIPTYNRNYYLSRCLWYHAHFPFGQIIVADSSQEEKKIVNRKTVEKVQEMFGADILYLEYEPETEIYGGDIYQKWGDAVMHVETEYSQICTDKEFFNPKVLIHHIYTLDKKPEYISCIGRWQTIRTNGNRTSCTLNPRFKSYEVNNAYQRYKKSLQYVPWALSHLHGTMRSNIHKRCYELLDNYNITDLRYGEIVVGYTAHLYGKTKHTSMPCRTRDLTHHKGVEKPTESSTLRYPCFDEYDVRTKLEFYRNYLCCINNELESEKVEGISMNQLISDLNMQMIDTYNLSNHVRGNTSRHMAYLSRIIHLFPQAIQELASFILVSIFHKSMGTEIHHYSKWDVELLKIINDTIEEYEVDAPVHYLY